MRNNTSMLRRKTKRERHFEFLQRGHLPVKPRIRVRPEAVCLAQAGPQIFDAQFTQPSHAIIEPVIFKMEPLTHSKGRRVLMKMF